MTADEFARFAAALRAKTATYKDLKAELTLMKEATSALEAIEAGLRERAFAVEASLQAAEKERGVPGYSASLVSADCSHCNV